MRSTFVLEKLIEIRDYYEPGEDMYQQMQDYIDSLRGDVLQSIGYVADETSNTNVRFDVNLPGLRLE